jgi:hypothetical protein
MGRKKLNFNPKDLKNPMLKKQDLKVRHWPLNF